MPRPSNREHLLDCAEDLFATQGVGAVSLRAIQAAAGLSVGSLRYHFKTESDLVSAVMERRLAPLMLEHERHLEAVAADPNPGVRQIIRAQIQPLIDLLAAEPKRGKRYLTLMYRLQVGHHTAPVLMTHWPDFAARSDTLFKKSLPHLSDDELAFRVDLAWETILGGLARMPELAPRDLEQHVTGLIDYLTGALEAPQTVRTCIPDPISLQELRQ